MTETSETIRSHAAFIWSVADLLRGDYKQSEYGRVKIMTSESFGFLRITVERPLRLR